MLGQQSGHSGTLLGLEGSGLSVASLTRRVVWRFLLRKNASMCPSPNRSPGRIRAFLGVSVNPVMDPLVLKIRVSEIPRPLTRRHADTQTRRHADTQCSVERELTMRGPMKGAAFLGDSLRLSGDSSDTTAGMQWKRASLLCSMHQAPTSTAPKGPVTSGPTSACLELRRQLRNMWLILGRFLGDSSDRTAGCPTPGLPPASGWCRSAHVRSCWSHGLQQQQRWARTSRETK